MLYTQTQHHTGSRTPPPPPPLGPGGGKKSLWGHHMNKASPARCPQPLHPFGTPTIGVLLLLYIVQCLRKDSFTPTIMQRGGGGRVLDHLCIEGTRRHGLSQRKKHHSSSHGINAAVETPRKPPFSSPFTLFGTYGKRPKKRRTALSEVRPHILCPSEASQRVEGVRRFVE